MAETTTTAVVGSTGLVGSSILQNLSTLPSTSTHVLSRRSPPALTPPTSSTITPHVSTESSTWSSALSTLSPPAQILFSALGTTRAAAGSTSAQRAIDYDLNLELAKAAHSAGTRVYVLISSAGANASSSMFYSRLKGELEEAVKSVGFEHVVILRPGVLLGSRQESRPAEAVIRGVAGVLKSLTAGKATDFWAQDASVVANAAVRAGLKCAKGGREPGVWEMGQADIVSLGMEK